MLKLSITFQYGDDFLRVEKGEAVSLLGQEENGWIYVQDEDGNQGLVPFRYIDIDNPPV